MPERDYYNYEDWLADGGPATGRPAPPAPNPYEPPSATPPTGSQYSWWSDPDNPPPAWMLDGNQQPTANPGPGRYWNWAGDHWEARDAPRYTGGGPDSTPGPTPGPTPDTGGPTGNFNYDSSDEPPEFNWTQFSPPVYTPRFGPFSAPSMTEAENEPGYQFSLNQGRRALESSAAGRGVLRTGGTLKDILEYGNQFAQQNYNNVFNRNYQTWLGNTAWDRDIFDRNYRGSKDAFDSIRDSERLRFADLYQRWRDRLNALTQIGTAGADG